MAQTNNKNSFKVRKYSSEFPSFPGGNDKLMQYLRNKTNLDFSATVHVKFKVRKSGKIKKVRILKGINKVVDKKAKKIVKQMPKWEPARIKGKPVSATFQLKLNFTKSY
jgi:TonB family protein